MNSELPGSVVDGSIDMARRGMLARHRLAPVDARLGKDRPETVTALMQAVERWAGL